ncbi:DUF1848 domain-containing protein [Brassicibacter mesophilus]|uniref:DUF1848 domain-containing protein n=1 Tax=Brassicibacter mesophilus TaxID=745119 RepID=UPI003D1A27E9
MILSVSRRTDIPAFYSEWFYNRLKEGFVLVRNPFNPNQISRIILNPEKIDCIVFWTKNPVRMMERINELSQYNYYFQFTLTSYDKSIERHVPKKRYLIDTFIELSRLIGKERVIWRYDPIILTDKYTKEYHYKWFNYLAEKLSGYTERCIISFLDLYKKTQHNMKGINLLDIQNKDMEEMADILSKTASKYNINIQSCSEEIDLERYNISHGKCIDDKLISKIIGKDIYITKDSNQRSECGCVKSIDIGAYNSCKHICLYCYANYTQNVMRKNVCLHDKNSPILIGQLNGNETIIDR